jgi:hypothetical protein
VARKTSKTKTPDELDCTKTLQEGLEHLLNEARQIRAMVEKLEARDDARELRRLVRRMKPPSLGKPKIASPARSHPVG